MHQQQAQEAQAATCATRHPPGHALCGRGPGGQACTLLLSPRCVCKAQGKGHIGWSWHMLPARKAHRTCSHSHTTAKRPHGGSLLAKPAPSGEQCWDQFTIVPQTTPGAHPSSALCSLAVAKHRSAHRVYGNLPAATTTQFTPSCQAQPPCADPRSPHDAMCSASGKQASSVLGHMRSMLVTTVETGSR